MYKLVAPIFPRTEVNAVQRLTDNAFIPFDPANTDYVTFKTDVLSGATATGEPVELQDADGNVMTQEEANAYIQTLP